jgi:hypothetical protein
MQTPTLCNAVQERIVAGDPLDEASQAHALGCASCGRVAAEWLALESSIADVLSGGSEVPDGFADRVMAKLEDEAREPQGTARTIGRRWLHIALANLGLAIAVANLLRFILSTLMPTASLGGAP